jgi:hypothetical protein
MRTSCMRVFDVTSTKGRCSQKRRISRKNDVSCIHCGMTLPRTYEKMRTLDDYRGAPQQGVFTLKHCV